MITTAQKWLRTIAWLRRNFPTQYPVRIRSVKLKWQGEIDLITTEFFVLKVNRKQSFSLRIDALIHEWAHALSWFGAETHNEDHSAEWGIQYAKIYRTFCEWNWGKESDDAL